MTQRSRARALVLAMAAALAVTVLAAGARAEGEDAGASWRLEQPLPPELPNGQKAALPVGLGRIGDIEFWAPNRGLLTTAGNPPAVPAGLWFYNGVEWHELANVCGATDGRIAWAGPDEFWTISDGRPGQVYIEGIPPLEDNTLCHFARNATSGALEVVASYASLAFLPSSYQAMDGAGCLSASDCWFGGEKLPDEQIGAFHLHWDGHQLTEETGPQNHAVRAMSLAGASLYESVEIAPGDEPGGEPESPTHPSFLHEIEPAGVQPTFISLEPSGEVPGAGLSQLPAYLEEQHPQALEAPRLGGDERSLWAAFDPLSEPAEGVAGEVTLLRQAEGLWTQVIGPQPGGVFTSNPFTREPGSSHQNEAIESIAPEPASPVETGEGEEHAWVALMSREEREHALAGVARVSSDGEVSERQTLPSSQEIAEGVEGKGAATQIACPAPHDCWLATSKGWLYHLAPEGERQLAPDGDPAFSSLVTFRPEDEGVPKTVPDAPPEDDSGLLGEDTDLSKLVPTSKESDVQREAVALLSHMHTRLVHGITLEFSFQLAVKARLALVARRHGKIVARTPTSTFQRGRHRMLLRLQRNRWPTKLEVQHKALAPLPTVPAGRGSESDTVTTSMLGRSPLSERLGRTFGSLESRRQR